MFLFYYFIFPVDNIDDLEAEVDIDNINAGDTSDPRE